MSGNDDPTFVPPEHVATVDLRGPESRTPREGKPFEVGPGTEAVKIGRYQLLELVGTGGMGMVWGAWDPELERRVALKLVRLTSRESRERMLREGQILARLSHPNVVPIFDVGIVGEQVYLVMEWVRGTTLREFATATPGWRPIVGAYRQAAAGLEAAHEAGVIHRDFKPDNAIRGVDGRVRVLDFGLAHSDGTSDALGPAGTPRYMAPEQRSGKVLGATVDQYAFGISLRDALADVKPPPWIAAIIERSTAGEPGDRFPSMSALLSALDRDPAQRWKRVGLGAAAAIAAVSAFAIGKSGTPASAPAIEPCIGGEAEIATAWNQATRDRVLTHLRGLGARANASVAALGTELDRYAAAWAAEHRHTCLANERKELTLPRYEARLGCLERTRAQLSATADLLVAVEADGLGAALIAARSLPEVSACADAGSVVPP
ncbi:MAG TPA: serine/threonine-protein kinase, partial [Kofleriaceae bacterium]